MMTTLPSTRPRQSITTMLRLIAVIFSASTFAGCASVLGHPEHPQAAPAVARLLSDDQLLVKEAKVEIAALGPGAMPTLLKSVAQATPRQQATILDLAMQIGEPRELVEKIVRATSQSQNVAVREYVAKKAANLVTEPASLSGQIEGTDIQSTYQQLLRDPSATVRVLSFQALLKSPSTSALRDIDLETLVHDEDPRIMTASAVIAAERGQRFSDFTYVDVQPNLIKHLKDSRPSVRAASCKVLGLLGERATSAVPGLRELIATEGESTVRLQAASALTKIGEPSGIQTAIPVLRELAINKDSSIRIAATSSLAQAELKSAQQSSR